MHLSKNIFSLAPLLSLFICVSCFHSGKQDLERKPANDVVKITLMQIGNEFQLTEEEMKENATILADFLEKKVDASKACPDQPSTKFEKLCLLISKISQKNTDEEKARRLPTPRLTKKNLLKHQNLSYPLAVKALSKKRANQVEEWADILTQSTDCPRNLSLAATRKLEENLPATKTFQKMESLYTHVSACLQPSDKAYEGAHYRQALLRKLFANDEGARAAIRLAAQATTSEEKGRVLYWLGRLTDNSSEKNKAWKELVEKQPLTYHALQVWREQAKDPLQKFNSRSQITVARSMEGLSTEVSDYLRWLESLYLIARPAAADRYTKWMVAQSEEPLPAPVVVYIASLKAGQDYHHNTIKFLTERVVKDPEILSSQVLKMLYPAPYYETFDRNSNGLDVFLVLGLARQESAFNPTARSPARAQGMMQVLPITARNKDGRRGRPNLFDVETNVRIGTKLLRNWIDQFGAVEYALAAYNAGPRRVPEWRRRYPTSDMSLFIDLIPFKETRNYVGSILRNNYWYHRLYDNDPLLTSFKKAEQVSEPTRHSQLVQDLLAVHTSGQSKSPNTP
ncbi:MAG: lytic transglycosylase domain-containing protein [Bdellovibrionales bacterium]